MLGVKCLGKDKCDNGIMLGCDKNMPKTLFICLKITCDNNPVMVCRRSTQLTQFQHTMYVCRYDLTKW